MELTAFGRGKLILFGEHACVYGLPAVGLPLPMETHVHLTLPSDGWDLSEVEEVYRGAIESVLSRAETAVPVTSRWPGKVTVTSSVPVATGFGSSAAVCVAFAKIFSSAPYQNLGTSHREIWELANELEKAFHGTPSGIDTGLSLSAGMRVFRGEGSIGDGQMGVNGVLPDSEEFESIPIYFVTGAVPRHAGTKELVGGVHERVRAGETAVITALSELGAIAEEAAAALRPAGKAGSTERPVAKQEEIDARYENLARLTEAAQDRLSFLGLSNPQVDEIIQTGKDNGALAGKVSGAGGGGAFFLLCPSKNAARACLARLAKQHPQPAEAKPGRPLPDMHLWAFEWTPRGAVSLT
mgnify:CR=1 FL=1